MQKLKKSVRKIFWPSLCDIFIVNGINECTMVEPRIHCEFVPITLENCHRVRDFREEDRVSEYRDKLLRKEIGFFAEHEGKMIGSVWATINKTGKPMVAQTFHKIRHNEALLHDIVIDEQFRGMRVGSFMDGRIRAVLFNEYKLDRLVTDVKFSNRASLRMLGNLDLRIDYRMFYLAVFGKVVVRLKLRKRRESYPAREGRA